VDYICKDNIAKTMVVISSKAIKEFIEKHKAAEDALNNWYSIMKEADFANFNDMRNVFNSVDAVGDELYVFNIKGNHFRLIARIHFTVRTVYIKFIGTHKQYDKVKLESL
jgi:mRNA interferase HigB